MFLFVKLLWISLQEKETKNYKFIYELEGDIVHKHTKNKKDEVEKIQIFYFMIAAIIVLEKCAKKTERRIEHWESLNVLMVKHENYTTGFSVGPVSVFCFWIFFLENEDTA